MKNEFFLNRLKYINNYKIRKSFNNKNIYLDSMENSSLHFKNILKLIILNIKNNKYNLFYNRYFSFCDFNLIRNLLLNVYFNIKDDDNRNVFIGNGSDEVIFLLILATLKNVGSFSPTFSIYRKHSKVLGKKYFDVNLNKKFDINYSKTNLLIKNKDISLFFISYPNNPTGNCFCKKKIFKLIKNNSKCLFISDEAYYDFSRKSLKNLKFKNLAILRTFSKIGFAGLRVGILLSIKSVINCLDKIKCPYNINSFSLSLIPLIIDLRYRKLLKIKTIIEERKKIFSFLKRKKIAFFKSCSNFFLIDNCFKKKLKFKRIFYKSFKKKPLKNLIRLSIGSKKENKFLISCFYNVKE